jgi:hypothetical protein
MLKAATAVEAKLVNQAFRNRYGADRRELDGV